MSASSLLRAEIDAQGPIPFSRFMEVALYDPAYGYYRKDHFGIHGDFYTAEQLQPTFGLLLRRFCDQQGITHIVQPGAGRAGLAPSFDGLRYTPIDLHYGAWPASFSGLVLAHEFFDALPVNVAECQGGVWHALRVTHDGSRFRWRLAEPIAPPQRSLPEEIERIEIPVGLPKELERIARHLTTGSLLVLDYGYSDRERLRFPQGSLLSYRRHQVQDDVLRDPGEQDITAHVPFTTLREAAHSYGFQTVLDESMGSFLLRVGEEDQFASVLSEAEPSRRLQLKTLLFDIGESFRAVLLKRS